MKSNAQLSELHIRCHVPLPAHIEWGPKMPTLTFQEERIEMTRADKTVDWMCDLCGSLMKRLPQI